MRPSLQNIIARFHRGAPRAPRVLGNIRNIKIQARLILLFLLLSLLPMLITSLYSYQKSSQAIQKKIDTYSLQIVNQVARNIKVQMTILENDTVDIGFSEIVQQTLNRYGSLSEWGMLDAQEIIQNMLVKKFTFLNDISDVLIFARNNETINAFGNKGLKLNLKQNFQKRLIEEIRRNNGVPVWKALGWEDINHKVNRIIEVKNSLIVCKAIRSLYEGEYIGAVVIRINERFFSEIYKEIDIGPGGEIFIIDGDGVVVSSRNPAIPFKRKFREPSLLNRIREFEKKGHDVFDISIGKKRYLTAFSPMGNARWYMVSTIPYSYLNWEVGKIRNGIMILGICCFLLAVLVSVLFTKSIAEPLKRLIHAMNEVKKGNLAVAVPDENHDEIAEVTRNFNNMVQEIDHLLQDIQKTEALKRDAELKALQAQINPHFLSNILNTAKLLANAQKAENIESLLTSLIQLLHVSMGKENDFITVRKEIEYLQNYLNIQEFRYFNKFQVRFDIEAEILDNQLPKFLLQPILENAIVHGIGPKKGQGIIEVKGFAFAGKMLFAITDDGIGMTQETIDRVLAEDNVSENQFCGIGVKNVAERVQLYFGPEYGLRIHSSPNYFTTVEITLPIVGPPVPVEGEAEC